MLCLRRKGVRPEATAASENAVDPVISTARSEWRNPFSAMRTSKARPYSVIGTGTRPYGLTIISMAWGSTSSSIFRLPSQNSPSRVQSVAGSRLIDAERMCRNSIIEEW